MAGTAKFSSKIGIIAATIGSAIGLGNVWRFPAETQANGGAAFLVIYVACVLILGVPVMVAEFSIGRRGNSDAIGSIRNITGKKKPYWLIGVLAVIVPYIILCYYMVVSGWTFSYLVHSIDGALYTPDAGQTAVDF
ncbi:MAG: sodium-dependent transporter, partial [Muribaculaceae bacterium]|nr:sodium-dependent transporter [Muribaculaceae bacterium]